MPSYSSSLLFHVPISLPNPINFYFPNVSSPPALTRSLSIRPVPAYAARFTMAKPLPLAATTTKPSSRSLVYGLSPLSPVRCPQKQALGRDQCTEVSYGVW